jgi:DNA-binding NarL/FixJ family response regulator
MRYDDLLAAIRRVHAQGRLSGPASAAAHPNGEAGRELTSRELEVLLLLRDGLSQDQISRRLAIADRTVRVHILALKEKLDAASTVQCVAKAYELGILRP